MSARERSPCNAGRRRSGAGPSDESDALRAFQQALLQQPLTARMQLEREGVPATLARAACRRLGLDDATVRALIGPSADHLRRGNRRWLAPRAACAILTLLDLLNRLEGAEALEPGEQDLAQWLGAWLQRPQPALGGAAPVAWLDTPTGRTAILQLLDSAIAGAFR